MAHIPSLSNKLKNTILVKKISIVINLLSRFVDDFSLFSIEQLGAIKIDTGTHSCFLSPIDKDSHFEI